MKERNVAPENVVKQCFDSEAGSEDLETSRLEQLEAHHGFEFNVSEFSHLATSN